MNDHVALLVLSSAVFAGCYTNVAGDSGRYLKPDQTAASLPLPVDAAAVEVVRVFATRGVILFDTQPTSPPGSETLTFAGARGRVGRRENSYNLGSVYTVRLEPTATGSQLVVTGKPTVDGVAPCTPGNRDGSPASCPDVTIDSSFSDRVTGQEEAAVIHSVLAELALDDTTRKPDPAAVAEGNARSLATWQASVNAAAEQRAACLAERHEIERRAEAMPDVDDRGPLLQTMPSCGPATATAP